MGEKKSDKKFNWNDKEKTLTVESHNTEVFTAEQLRNIWEHLEHTKTQIVDQKASMEKRIPELDKGLVAIESDMRELKPFFNKLKEPEPAKKGSAE